jgi:hypothetical protein
MDMDLLIRALAALAVLLSVASVAAAQQERFGAEFPLMSLEADPVAPEAAKLPWRTFELAGGVSYASVTSTLTMGRGNGGVGVAVDAEGVLGMSREVLCPMIWAAWRMGDTHRLMASFEDLTRTATRTLEADVTFNGNTYTVGTTLHSVYGVQLYNLIYGWSFLQDDRMDIALTAGVHAIRLHAGISAENPPRDENSRFIIPIPLPGLTADFALTPSFWLRQRLELMYVPIANYSGLLIDYKLALELNAFSHLSFGIGLDLLRIDLQKHSSSDTLGNFEGEFRVAGSGVMLYANLHW